MIITHDALDLIVQGPTPGPGPLDMFQLVQLEDADPEFGQGGPPASETESCQCSKVSNLWPGPGPT